MTRKVAGPAEGPGLVQLYLDRTASPTTRMAFVMYIVHSVLHNFNVQPDVITFSMDQHLYYL